MTTCHLQGVGNTKTYEGSWVQALNQAGFSVAGIDNRGCGRSSGLLGYIVSSSPPVAEQQAKQLEEKRNETAP